MKNIIKLLFPIIFAILTFGYLLKNEVFFMNFGDTYYLLTYWSIAQFLVLAIMLFIILGIIIKKTRSKSSS